jgi:oligoendopeptidase F
MTAFDVDELPRWSTADVYDDLGGRAFADAMERCAADADRLVALFDEHDIRAIDARRPTPVDGAAADAVLREYNRVASDMDVVEACVYAVVSTNSRDARAQGLLSELEPVEAAMRPLLSRLADWIAALGADDLALLSDEAHQHLGPLRRFAARASHQMSEAEEHLYAELSSTGSGAWGRLQQDLTSQLTAEVAMPSGTVRLPMPAVRGLATDADVDVRRAAYQAELEAWPTIEVSVAAAMNAIKGEANSVNRRRHWDSPLEA